MKRIDFIKTLQSGDMATELYGLLEAVKVAEREAPSPTSGSSLYETSRERAYDIKRRAIEAWLDEVV